MGTLMQIRRVIVAFIDETTSLLFGPAGKVPRWLWAMACPTLCVFMIQELIGDWAIILVSDGFVVYLKQPWRC